MNRNNFCLFLRRIHRGTLLHALQSLLKAAVCSYKNSALPLGRVGVIFLLSMHFLPEGVLGLPVFSLLISVLFATRSRACLLAHDAAAKDPQSGMSGKLGLLFSCMFLPCLGMACRSDNPFTRNCVGEAALWAFVSAAVVVLHDAVRDYQQGLPEESRMRFLLKRVTAFYLGNFIPLGPCLVFVLYAPYAGVYWALFHFSSRVSNASVAYMLLLALPLLAMVAWLYYRCAIYLVKKMRPVHASR